VSNAKCPLCKAALGTGEYEGRACLACQRKIDLSSGIVVNKAEWDRLQAENANLRQQRKERRLMADKHDDGGPALAPLVDMDAMMAEAARACRDMHPCPPREMVLLTYDTMAWEEKRRREKGRLATRDTGTRLTRGYSTRWIKLPQRR
jgi:hypothetical protein